MRRLVILDLLTMHSLRRAAAVSCALIVGAAFPILAGESNTLVSPRGTFTITDVSKEYWTSTLRVKKGDGSGVVLADEYYWRGEYYVSPDDRWILQIQKIASGDNISCLYRLDPNGRLWRMQQRLDELAFKHLERSRGLELAQLYHTRTEFKSWNLKAGTLRFVIHASTTEENGEGVTEELIYDLQSHDLRTP